jgi:hypothetical protein
LSISAKEGVRSNLFAIATRRPWQLLLLTLLFLQVLPVWIYPYFPSQDGPSHIYNANLLLQYLDHGNYQIRHFFDVHFSLAPNVTVQWLLPLMLLILDPLSAQQLLVSLIIVLLPLSIVYLGNYLKTGNNWLVVGAFVFAHHNFLHMGFFAYSLGISISFFTIGYWLRIRFTITLPKLCIFFTLGYLTFLTHFAPFAAMLAILATIFLSDAIRWLYCLNFQKLKKIDTEQGIGSIRNAVFQLYALLPFMFLGVFFRNLSPSDESTYKGIEYLLDYARENLGLVTYTNSHVDVVSTLWVLIFAAIVLNISLRIHRRIFWSQRDVILLAFAVLAALYFTQPWSSLNGNAMWINERILLIAMPLGFTWYERFPKVIELFLSTCFVVVLLWHVTLLASEYSLLQPELEELVSARELIEPHSTLAYDNQGSYFDSLGAHTQFTSPLEHMGSYYGFKRDVAYVDNYEANWRHFMVEWGNIPGPNMVADYLLQSRYRADDHDDQAYDLIFHGPRIKLLKKKELQPNLESWDSLPDGRIRLHIEMSEHNNSDREDLGFVTVSGNTLYKPGTYGWINGIRLHSAEPRSDYRRIITSRDDAAFRVALPNGSYQVTCHFPGNGNGWRQVNVIANDEKVVSALVLEPGEEPHEATFDVRVVQKRLDLVFYTKWKAGNRLERLPFWSLSGITVTSLDRVSGVKKRVVDSHLQNDHAPEKTLVYSRVPRFESIKISQSFESPLEYFGLDRLDPSSPLRDIVAQWDNLDFAPDWLLDLDLSNYFEITDSRTAYVLAELHAQEKANYKLGIGSDDGVTVWLNGEKIQEKLVLRTARAGEDKLNLHLKPGKNLILFRINNLGGDWRLIASLEE